MKNSNKLKKKIPIIGIAENIHGVFVVLVEEIHHKWSEPAEKNVYMTQKSRNNMK